MGTSVIVMALADRIRHCHTVVVVIAVVVVVAVVVVA